MTNLSINSAIAQSIALLSHYGFELRGYTAQELVTEWLTYYQANWIRLAVIEALYQGRYKAVSIEQILSFWARREEVTFHFSHEFERMISRKLPRNLALLTYPAAESDLDYSNYEDLNWEWETNDTQQTIHQKSETPPSETSPSLTPQLPKSFLWHQEKVSLEEQSSENSTVSETSSNREETVKEEMNSQTKEQLKINESPPEINQFTPSPDGSRFYSKLKAVAQDNASSRESDTSTPFKRS
ncbi:MAG: hypothetical protein ACOC0N_02020 [Chroococcales cyanobacterium]